MEDTHVWTLDVTSGERRELGATIDNRQSAPQWSPDGQFLYFTVQSRGSVRLHRLPATGGAGELVLPAADARANVGAFSIGKDGTIAYAMATPGGPAELYVKRAEGDGPVTTLNRIYSAARRSRTSSRSSFARSMDARWRPS
jgi:Tol biopolymer transport system component